jgi:tRNA(Ile)-lysidine synthase
MKRSISAADTDAAAGAPLTGDEFARLLAPLGPFEPAPHLAVAVSGGADSLALALLADFWARERGGSVTALTVDHRLRPGSTDEAERVRAWLSARGIAHRILTWLGPYPLTDLQAAARAARYRLLADWCRDAGVLHLLIAHHRDDQAETLLLRLGRGSGAAGLAGMAALVEQPDCRLLRPFLSVPPARLRATLDALDQPWIEDPSNRNPVFARVRLRVARQMLDGLGLSPARLADTAGHLGRARAALEAATDALLAKDARRVPHRLGARRAAHLSRTRRRSTQAAARAGRRRGVGRALPG